MSGSLTFNPHGRAKEGEPGDEALANYALRCIGNLLVGHGCHTHCCQLLEYGTAI